MTKITIILGIVIIILCSMLGLTYKQMRSNHKEAIRWEENYNQSQNEISRVQMTLGEFKEKATRKEDSLLDALSIKPKQVEKIVYIENSYVDKDTSIIEFEKPDDFIELGERDRLLTSKFIHKKDCLSIEGFVTTTDANLNLNFTKVQYNNNYSYVAYWKRHQWKILGIKTRFLGKKYGELEIVSTCGNIKVKEIDIIKRK